MGKYNVQVELLKGEDPIDFPEDYTGEDLSAAMNGAQLAFDKGEADKVVFYIDKDGELLDILTKSKSEFDRKEAVTHINEIKEKFGA